MQRAGAPWGQLERYSSARDARASTDTVRGNESCAGGAIQRVGDLVEAVVEEMAVQIEVIVAVDRASAARPSRRRLRRSRGWQPCGAGRRHEAVKAGPSRRRCEHVAPEAAGTQGLALRRGEHEIAGRRPATCSPSRSATKRGTLAERQNQDGGNSTNHD